MVSTTIGSGTGGGRRQPSSRIAWLAACALGVASAAASAQTPPATQPAAELQALIDRGDYAAALARVDALLAERPGDERLTRARALLAERVASPSSRPAAVPSTRPAAEDYSPADRLAVRSAEAAMADVARAAGDPAQGAKVPAFAREVLSQTADVVERHPDDVRLWQLRAAAALAIDDEDAGVPAAARLMAARADASADPAVSDLMVRLNRKGWLSRKGVLGIALVEGDGTAPSISSVSIDSPARAAGLRRGDAILSVDGQATPTAAAAIGQVGKRAAGDAVALKVRRGTQTLDISAKLIDAQLRARTYEEAAATDARGTTGFNRAVEASDWPLMRRYLGAGYPVAYEDDNGTQRSLLAALVVRKKPAGVRALLEAMPEAATEPAWAGPMALAACFGEYGGVKDFESLRALLDGGVSPNAVHPKSGKSFVLLAADAGAEPLAAMIAHGASVDGPPGGRAPLFDASEDATKLLLKRGANPNVMTAGGNTPLHECVSRAGKMQLLLNSGARVDARNDEGDTPLQKALSYRESVLLLLAARADINTKNKLGLTPLGQVRLHIQGTREMVKRGFEGLKGDVEYWQSLEKELARRGAKEK